MSWICGLLSLFLFLAFVIIGGALLFKLFKAVATPTKVGPGNATDQVSPRVASGTIFDPYDPWQRQQVLKSMAQPTDAEIEAKLLQEATAKKLGGGVPLAALVLSLILTGASHAGPPTPRPAPSCQGKACQAAAVQLPEARPVVREDAAIVSGGSCQAVEAKACSRGRWVVQGRGRCGR